MRRTDAGWELRVPMPKLDCLEYLFDVAGEGMVTDPTNPDVKDGAFGPHSFLALPGYASRGGSSWSRCEGRLHEVAVDAVVWQPASVASNDRLPMLVAHDGPEMDGYGRLTTYVAALVGAGELPAMRVALLAPGPRDERYAANPAYPSKLGGTAVSRLLRQYPSDHRAGAHRPEPRRARRPARGLEPAGHLRRAVPAERLVLHPGPGPAGVGLLDGSAR